MKVKTIYYKGFFNFLHTPESDEEHAALVEMAIRSKEAEEYQELLEELERNYENGIN